MRDTGHVNEEAELYALGTLGEIETARIERHVRTCDDCARRLGEAEATVLRLIESDVGDRAQAPPARPLLPKPRTRVVEAAAAAAAVAAVITFALTTYVSPVREHSERPSDRPALTAMLAGHFLHAPFAGRAPAAPAAKVIYAREGGWIYVIAAPGKDALDVFVDARPAPVASLAPSDAVRSSFVTLSGRVTSVDLVDRGATVATAHLVYPRR